MVAINVVARRRRPRALVLLNQVGLVAVGWLLLLVLMIVVLLIVVLLLLLLLELLLVIMVNVRCWLDEQRRLHRLPVEGLADVRRVQVACCWVLAEHDEARGRVRGGGDDGGGMKVLLLAILDERRLATVVSIRAGRRLAAATVDARLMLVAWLIVGFCARLMRMWMMMLMLIVMLMLMLVIC